MRFAYADPPYLGCCGMYGHRHEGPHGCWDDPDTHAALVDLLALDFPDGWAMSLSSVSLGEILSFCPPVRRVGAWVKPFASFKPGVGVAYAWEPVIFCGGRKRTREQDTVRDWVAANITLERGLTGAKPREVCRWLFDVLGAQPGDEFVDLFPGSGAVTAAWEEFSRQTPEQLALTPTEAA
jgi:hypothetical protein